MSHLEPVACVANRVDGEDDPQDHVQKAKDLDPFRLARVPLVAGDADGARTGFDLDDPGAVKSPER
jgi:hypothetical protein